MTLRRLFLMIVLCAISMRAVGQEATQTFCQRLAPQINMKPVPVTPKSSAVIWKTDTASVGMHLFGGTAVTRLTVTPLDTTNAAEFVRLDKACDVTAKGALCHLVGPAKVVIRTRRFEANAAMAVGERANVEVRDTVVLCEDTPQ
jgi:hypothetical protein